MLVKDIMNSYVVTISPDENASVAARMLSRHNVGILPVCTGDGKLQGVVTDRDIVLRCIAADKKPDQTPVKNVMTSRVVTVSPQDDYKQASQKMAREQVRRILVTDQEKLVGILSLGDLTRAKDLKLEAAETMMEICSNIHKK